MQPVAGDPWFIIFGDPVQSRSAWWHRLLADGYGHCMAARAASPISSLTVEHVGSHLRVLPVDQPVDDLVLDYLQNRGARHVLRYVVPDRPEMRAQIRPPMTCVEAVKAILGLSAPWVLTPAQLARHLRARGAWDVPVFDPMARGAA